jgi:propanol-preferring alcohol dehydrogenase
MKGMLLHGPPGPDGGRLVLEELDAPVPASGDLLVRVSVCAVCRTDLDIVDGRLTSPRYPVIPGHQVIGTVAAVGKSATAFREGERVGVAWIHFACGHCRWCLAGDENLCPEFRSTGCDANGGYAEYLTVPAAFAHVVPDELDDVHAAPLLCAGAIGWRSLRLTNLPDGEPLGLTGFGASAHLVLQLAKHRFPSSSIYVFARQQAERDFAKTLGASWVGGIEDSPPAPMAAIVDTTPAWKPLVQALAHLAPAGRLVVNAIRKMRSDQEELLRLDYPTHLWMEHELKSVANVTRADVREMLAAAVELHLRPTVEEMPLERANDALDALRRGEAVHGARVLRVS